MKLLRHTVKSYLIYSALVLLIAIPIFYFTIQALCLQDVDEALQYRKTHLAGQLKEHDEILTKLPWHDLNNAIAVYPPVSNAISEKKITLQRYNTLSGEQESFRELRTFFKINGKIYPAVLRISLIGIEDLIQGIVLTEILLMILIMGGLLWINRQQSKKIWQPFYQTLGQLKQFSLSKKHDLQFITTNISEFKDLQQVATTLVERTYKIYLQQKEFTENAAHEMQTPLSIIQARLEMLMQDEQLTRTQTEHIQLLENTIIRMSKLNKGLLLLAKIENKQFGETESINILVVTKAILSQLMFQLQLKNLTLSEAYQECMIQSNPVLIGILLTNLLNNAIRYAPEGSTISVKIFASGIEVRNAGELFSFPEGNVFDRFQRSNHADAFHGNGLGLAIVKQICNAFQYKVYYSFKEGIHLFKVVF